MSRTVRSAFHPLALAMLATGGVTGALVTWPLAAAGVVAYAGVVGLLARRTARSRDAELPEPTAPASGIRSTAVIAQTVRIRKAHQALHRAVTGSPSLRRLLSGAYVRACELVEYAYRQAHVADDMRARLDLPADTRRVGPAREELEAAYGKATGELTRVAIALEDWHHKIAARGTESNETDAEQAASDVAAELERMLDVQRELDAVTGNI